jgi:hypothetical protein
MLQTSTANVASQCAWCKPCYVFFRALTFPLATRSDLRHSSSHGKVPHGRNRMNLVPAILGDDEKRWITPEYWGKCYRMSSVGCTPKAQRERMAADGWIAECAFRYSKPGYVAFVECFTGEALVVSVEYPK